MERDGVVVLEDFFPESELAAVSDAVDDVVAGRAAYLPAAEMVYEPDSDPPRLRNAFRMHHYNELFMNLAGHPRLTEVVASMLGNPLRLYGSQIFAKPAQVGSVVPKHQDMPYWPFAPAEMISAWIALDDSTIENGCVRFALGSHLLGPLPHEPSGVSGNSLVLSPNPEVDRLPEMPIEVRRGSCVLHHCLAVHRSEPNRSPKPRRGLIYVYMSPAVQVTDPSKLRGPREFPQVA